MQERIWVLAQQLKVKRRLKMISRQFSWSCHKLINIHIMFCSMVEVFGRMLLEEVPDYHACIFHPLKLIARSPSRSQPSSSRPLPQEHNMLPKMIRNHQQMLQQRKLNKTMNKIQLCNNWSKLRKDKIKWFAIINKFCKQILLWDPILFWQHKNYMEFWKITW